jgi:SAM-dependent methyltransferase
VSVSLLRADAGRIPLADASVDLIVTSPPYWALRSYIDGGEHYDGQIGSEPNPAAYINSLIRCTAEWVRVLKPGGSIWVNLGDKYSDRGHGPSRGTGRAPQAETLKQTRGPLEKSLLLLPERYRIAAVDRLCLIARAVVIWDKLNGLPESVTDRVRRSHEDWVHLVKQPRYFAAVDAIREPAAESTRARWGADLSRRDVTHGRQRRGTETTSIPGEYTMGVNPLGKLPGSVRTVATQPLKVPAELGIDHFAAFPMEWPRWIIAGWTPTGICTACGEGRRPVSESRITADRGGRQFNPTSGNIGVLGKERVYTITGETCACPDTSAPTRPAVVVDPFGGTGTTALVAHVLGRRGISVDMSADYCRLARWRTSDPGQLAAAMGVEKPPTEHAGQLDLFAEEGAA